MSPSHIIPLGLVAGFFLASSPARAANTTLAVLDLTAKGAPPELAQNLTDIVAGTLSSLAVFEVLSRSDIEQMIAFEQEKQMFGCENDTSCLAEIGGALGVSLLVTGSIGKVGNSFILSLILTDTAKAEVLAREQRTVAKADDLPGQAEGAARFLVRKLLAGQQGFLVIEASESGAEVELDGRVIGMTPLPRQTLAGGPHKLRLAKKGFITWARDILIEKEQVAVVDASMAPSLEFIEAYDSEARTWRLLAYGVGGLGLAGIGFGIGGWLYNNNRAAAFNDDVAAAGCVANGGVQPSGNCTELFAKDRKSIESFHTAVVASGVVGTVALAAGVFFWAQGPAPGLYDRYKAETEVPVSAAVGPGGASLTIRFP